MKYRKGMVLFQIHLDISFQWVFLPFVLLLVALVVRSAWGIWQAIRGQGLEAQGLPT